jgi:hypothetical protein
MKKKHGIVIEFAALLTAVILIFTGCSNPTNSTKTDPGRATQRYETVPYTKSGSRASENGGDKLVYSAYDDNSFYYLFLLGHVTRVPLAYRPAVEYNGTTNISIGYSSSNVTEESITESVEEASEHSVTDSMTHSWGVEVTSEFGKDDAFFKMSVMASAGGEYGWEESNSRSFANTYETARSKATEVTDDISVTIGENDEPAGLYRYSLFSTTDVYYVVITNKAKTDVTKSYIALCARPQTFWGLDYEPDLGGSFGKTAPGDLLEVPELILANLPTPTEIDLEPIPEQMAVTPVANNKSGTYESKVTVTLTSQTQNAVIYYTTNGNTPTEDSTRYTASFDITQSAKLKAIAIAPPLYSSPVMTEEYTITEPALQTEWYIKLTTDVEVTDSRPHLDYLSLQNFPGFQNYDVEKLKAEGYTSVEFTGQFDVRPISDGYVHFSIRGGHGANGPEWASRKDIDPSGYGWDYWNMPGTTIPFSSFNKDFTLIFSASGAGNDDYMLGTRWVKFVAKKAQ